MQIQINDTYPGEPLLIALLNKPDCPVSLQICGYIESPQTRIQHLKSSYRTITESSLVVQLPCMIPPSFKIPHFQVWYECRAMSTGSGAKHHARSTFTVSTNNLLDFSRQTAIFFNLQLYNYDAYYKAKQKIAGLLFTSISANIENVGNETPTHHPAKDSDGASKTGQIKSMAAREKLTDFAVDDQSLLEIYGTQASMPECSFESPPYVKLPEQINRIVRISSDTGIIATIMHPCFFQESTTIKMSYHNNIALTKITVYKEVYEAGSLKDMAIVFESSYGSDGYLSRFLDIVLDGFSIKTSLFEVKYIMDVILDDCEVSLDLQVICKGALFINPDLYNGVG